MSENRRAFRVSDDFWDIEAPPKNYSAERKLNGPSPRDTSAVEIEIPGKRADVSSGAAIPPMSEAQKQRHEQALRVLKEIEARKNINKAKAFGDKNDYSTHIRPLSSVSAKEAKAEPIFEYTPEHRPLIRSVRVFDWPTQFSFYHRFLENAKEYFDVTVENAKPVSYFSFMPQHSQLSKEQLKYYFYWRTCVRRGEFFEIDQSYFLLYVYELINMSSVRDPKECLDMLISVSKAYSAKFPKLRRSLAEWITDLCLIYRLSLPKEFLSSLSLPTLSLSPLREMLIGDSVEDLADFLLFCVSNYNYKQSSFITAENAHIFNKFVTEAFRFTLQKVGFDDHSPFQLRRVSIAHVSRDSFNGAVCAFEVKKKIELEYYVSTRSVEYRMCVTDTVKYIENNLRFLLGIRNRFHTKFIDSRIKEAVDEFFAPFKEKKHRSVKVTPPKPVPEYEKYYEPEMADFSPEYALELEKDAWETASKLIVEDDAPLSADSAHTEGFLFANEAPEQRDTEDDTDAAEGEIGINTDDSRTDGIIIEALTALFYEKYDDFKKTAAEHGIMADTLAEKINEAAIDRFGDVAVESDGERYAIISDYTEEISEWIKAI